MTDASDKDQRKPDSGPGQERRSMADGDLRAAVPLRSYLEGVGVLMDRPLKYGRRGRAARPSAASSAAAVAPTRMLRNVAALMVIAAALLFVVSDSARHPNAGTTLPVALQGVWRTDAVAYANRRLEITTSSLAFQEGDSTIDVTRHPIVRVRESAAPGGTLFRIEYLQDGDLLEFSFVWRSLPQPELRFANQKGLVWTRTGPADSAPVPGRPAR